MSFNLNESVMMMKKLFALGWMLVAALTLTHCSKDEVTTPAVDGEKFAFYANTGESRTTMEGLKTTWTANDAMNVWTASADGYTSHGEFKLTDAESGKFEGTLDASFSATAANDWYVIYPYSKYGLMPVNSTDKGTWMFVGHTSPIQEGNNSQAHLSGSSAPLYGIAKNVADSEAPVFQMHHLSTFVRIRLTNNTTAPFAVASIYMTSESGVELAGKYYLDITGSEVQYLPYQVNSEVTLTVNEGEEIAVGKDAEFYLPLAPIQFGANDEMLTLNIKTTEGATIVIEKTIPATTKFAAGKMYTLKAEATADNTEYPQAATWTLLAGPDEMTDGQYIIVARNSATETSYLPSTTTSKAPAYCATELFDLTSRTLELNADEKMVWNFEKSGDAWFITNNSGAYFYGTNDNNGLRVGSTKHTWSIGTHAKNSAAFVFKETTTNRFVGIYNKQDWRCYTAYDATNYGTNAIKSQIYLYYKGALTEKPALEAPVVAATSDESTITATWAAIEHAASYTATCRNLLTSESVTQTVTETTCTFTELESATEYEILVVANPAEGDTTYRESAAGSATVKTSGDVTYTPIADIHTSGIGTYNIKNVTVVAVSTDSYANALVTDGTGYLYAYCKLDAAVGDVLTLNAAEITQYNNQCQINKVAEIKVVEEGTTVTHPTPEVISAADYDTKSKTGNFSVGDYVQVSGVFTISGNYFNFNVPGSTQKGSLKTAADFSAFNNQYVAITGYVLYSGTFYTLFATEMAAGENYLYTEPAAFEWKADSTEAQTATVKADHTWSVTSNPEWLTVTPTATTVVMTPSVNTAQQDRSGEVVLTDELGATWKIQVKQSAATAAGEKEATLSFANKAQRTEFSSTKQVWEQNGITVTNLKASSTNAVADYANPARFYANSSLEITAPGEMSKIVFTANSPSYATALKNSIGTVSGATVAVSGSTVTVTFSSPVASFKIAKFSAQVRMNSLKVTYIE